MRELAEDSGGDCSDSNMTPDWGGGGCTGQASDDPSADSGFWVSMDDCHHSLD